LKELIVGGLIEVVVVEVDVVEVDVVDEDVVAVEVVVDGVVGVDGVLLQAPITIRTAIVTTSRNKPYVFRGRLRIFPIFTAFPLFRNIISEKYS